MKDPQLAVNVLRGFAAKLGVKEVFETLLEDYPQFEKWSGSHRSDFHHYGYGGLIRHTCEVVEIGLCSANVLCETLTLDGTEYYLSALFHDTGKMYDYKFDDNPNFGNDRRTKCWQSTPHKRLIHHISRSVLIWHDTIKEFPEFYDKYHDRVMHNILAHHGQREWGSPVAPKSKEAWLLHLADGISARMDDADKMDVVNKKE